MWGFFCCILLCFTDRGPLNHTAFFSKLDGAMVEEAPHIETTTQQTLHYTLANQQVQFHRISEDGQVQVVSVIVSLCLDLS